MLKNSSVLINGETGSFGNTLIPMTLVRYCLKLFRVQNERYVYSNFIYISANNIELISQEAHAALIRKNNQELALFN